MKLTDSEKKVKAQEPPEDTLEYELYISGLDQEIIELTEVVEEEAPVGEEGASSTRTLARPSEGFELVREELGPERQTLEARSGLRATVLPQTTSAKGATGPAQEGRPEAKANKDVAVPIATEDRKPDLGNQGTEDLEHDQIFAEFFASLDVEDFCEKMTGAGGSFDQPTWEEVPKNEDDDFKELLEEMDFAEQVAVEELSESNSLAGQPVATARLQNPA
jgi:hypothetical protein